MDDNQNQLRLKEKQKNPYSNKYRYIKTVLMIYAWVSFGIQLEPIGVALEDLRILLEVDYKSISVALVSRSISYMIVTVFIGFVIDRLSKYSDFLMAFAKLLMVIPNFLLPWISNFYLSMSLFLLQGCGQALYDVCGNQIIFRLWSGISESPVNAMHAGYGIGAMLIVQLLKPFIKFNPQEDSILNGNATKMTESDNFTTPNITRKIISSDIQLQIPYSVAGIVGVVTIVIFIIAQFFEFKEVKKSEDYNANVEETPLKDMRVNRSAVEERSGFSKFIFGRYVESNRNLCIMTIELFILFTIFMAVMAFNMVLTAYMLTYATKGPAKFERGAFLTIQTLFWIIFIVGRFSAALIGFKLDSFYFFTGLVSLNTILAAIFTTKLNEIQNFYWFIILAIGFSNGPLIPSAFAVAKYVFVKTNALLVSIFCIGLGVGSLGATYLTGYILDAFKPSESWLGYTNPTSHYAIPLILTIIAGYSVIATIVALIIYRVFKDSFSESTNDE